MVRGRTAAYWVLVGMASCALASCSGGRRGGPMSNVGGACMADADCPAGLTCFTGPVGARPWTGGYCTRTCSRDDCPTGSRCALAYYDATGLPVTECLAECSRAAGTRGGCRDGYVCGFDGLCFEGCSSDAQCQLDDTSPGTPLMHPGARCETTSGRCLRGSTTGHSSGEACTSDADCQGPTGGCIGGVCYRTSCDLGGANACASGETCIGDPVPGDAVLYICADDCTVGTDGILGHAGVCGAGLACLPPEFDITHAATGGVCFYPLSGTLMTNAAAHVGDPCHDVSECPNPLGYAICNGVCAVAYCAVSATAGMDLCGPGTICSHITAEPGAPRDVAALVMAGLCLRSCTLDTDCPSNAHCVAGGCQTDLCATDADCPTTATCNPVDGACHPR